MPEPPRAGSFPTENPHARSTIIPRQPPPGSQPPAPARERANLGPNPDHQYGRSLMPDLGNIAASINKRVNPANMARGAADAVNRTINPYLSYVTGGYEAPVSSGASRWFADAPGSPATAAETVGPTPAESATASTRPAAVEGPMMPLMGGTSLQFDPMAGPSATRAQTHAQGQGLNPRGHTSMSSPGAFQDFLATVPLDQMAPALAMMGPAAEPGIMDQFGQRLMSMYDNNLSQLATAADEGDERAAEQHRAELERIMLQIEAMFGGDWVAQMLGQQ